MNSENSNFSLIEQHYNHLISSYNTVTMILNPTLNEFKQNFLSSLTSTLISQLNFLIQIIKEEEENKINELIQSNLSILSKNIANLLSFINERKFILNYNHQNSFSILNKLYNTPNKNSFSISSKKKKDNSINSKLNFSKQDNKKEIKKNKKNSIEKTKNNLPKIINGIKSKISQQLSKKKINEKIINMSLDNYYTLPNNSFLTTQINSNKKHYINLRYSQNLNKSSPNIFQRSKSALKEKYKKNNIINNIFNNEKFSYDFEEKKNKVTPFAKYLISKYKNVVDNYEKLENDEQIQMEEIYNRKSKGKNKLNNSFNQKTLSDKFVSLNLRNSNKISNNGNNYNSNNSIPSKIVVIKKID